MKTNNEIIRCLKDSGFTYDQISAFANCGYSRSKIGRIVSQNGSQNGSQKKASKPTKIKESTSQNETQNETRKDVLSMTMSERQKQLGDDLMAKLNNMKRKDSKND